MSGIQGALYSSVTGLSANASAISMTADNISNAGTDGYKRTQPVFSSLVTAASSSGGYNAGGITSGVKQNIDEQGAFKVTGVATDLAIQGRGLFAVNTKPDGTGNTLYTRAGGFHFDSKGYLTNSAGMYLLAYPLDDQGRLPGVPGNSNTSSTSSLSSLQVVSQNGMGAIASATANVSLGLNLNSQEKIFLGPNASSTFPSNSVNYQNGANSVIVPDTGATNTFSVGDGLTLTPSTTNIATTFTYGGFAQSGNIANGIYGSTDTFTPFTGINNGDGITFSHQNIGSVSFKYQAIAPAVASGEFNSISTFVDAVNQVKGLSARIVGNNVYVSALDTTLPLTMSNISAQDVIFNFGLVSPGGTPVAATPLVVGGSANTFSTLTQLNNLINKTNGLNSTITSPLTSSTISFNSTNPQGTLTVTGVPGAASTSTAATIFAELGINNVTSGTPIASTYSQTLVNKDMANGIVPANHKETVTIYDSLGTPHDITIGFLKVGLNQWAVEIYPNKPADVVSPRVDKQLAAGFVNFNSDGSLNSISASLTQPVAIQWADQSSLSNVAFNWGTAGPLSVAGAVGVVGQKNGLRQLDSSYLKNFINVDGAKASNQSGIAVNSSGVISALYDTGTQKSFFQIAIADFPNINGLQSQTGNTYAQSNDSGLVNLKISGTDPSVGSINSGSIEQSTVDLATEITDLIIRQRNYQSCSKAIKSVDELLGQLNQIV